MEIWLYVCYGKLKVNFFCCFFMYIIISLTQKPRWTLKRSINVTSFDFPLKSGSTTKLFFSPFHSPNKAKRWLRCTLTSVSIACGRHASIPNSWTMRIFCDSRIKWVQQTSFSATSKHVTAEPLTQRRSTLVLHPLAQYKTTVIPAFIQEGASSQKGKEGT